MKVFAIFEFALNLLVAVIGLVFALIGFVFNLAVLIFQAIIVVVFVGILLAIGYFIASLFL